MKMDEIDVHISPLRRAKEMAQSVAKGLTLQVWGPDFRLRALTQKTGVVVHLSNFSAVGGG